MRDPSPHESNGFLGFTHHWGKSQRGAPIVVRRTARSRLTRAARGVWLWCRAHRHAPLRVQQTVLASKLRGHFGYHGISGNGRALDRRAGACRPQRRGVSDGAQR
jgi:hypothetical protein